MVCRFRKSGRCSCWGRHHHWNFGCRKCQYEIQGSLDAGSGDDLVFGDSSGDYGIYNLGTLTGGSGNDTIRGIGKETGVVNVSSIDTGSGSDTIEESTKQDGTGVNGFGTYNVGIITTGSSNDVIRGTGLDAGIFNDGSIDMGSGADSIEGVARGGGGIDQEGKVLVTTGVISETKGIIQLGAGKDTVKGEVDSFGIFANGTIDGGEGNDFMSGDGGIIGIANATSSIITAGKGNDIIEGLGSF